MKHRILSYFWILACVTFFSAPLNAQVKSVVRVSLSSSGAEANGGSACPQISGNGRYVVFSSTANNLVDSPSSPFGGLFRRDLNTNTTVRVDTNSNGEAANQFVNFGGCDYSLAAGGEVVAISTNASNLVFGPAGNQIFLKNLSTGAVTEVSVSSSGSHANNNSQNPATSSDGRYVAFASDATNLVDNDTNFARDVFVRDTVSGTTTRVSVATDGTQANALCGNPDISEDGRYVFFTSFATNLVSGSTTIGDGLYIRDTVAGTTTKVNFNGQGIITTTSDLSPDGRYVVFSTQASDVVSGDTNNTVDVFVYDTIAGTTKRVTVDSTGVESNGISYHGINHATISSGGRFATFGSAGSNLVPGDINGTFDIFVRDLTLEKTIIANVRPTCLTADEQASEASEGPSMSSDGQSIAFLSIASNLVAGDTNSVRDVFVSVVIPPATFSKKPKLTDAPNSEACTSATSITAPIFIQSSTNSSGRVVSKAKKKKISYEIEVKSSTKKSDKKRKRSKSNNYTIPGLKPGTYSSRYRLVKGKEPFTRYSPARTFTVPSP